MKYIVILGDGMADYKIHELGEKTPLQYANKPNMNRLAKLSKLGLAHTVPQGFPPGSDVANLSVMGYDPKLYYTGRSPLEAVSMGVSLDENDVAFRCNLVTLSSEEPYAEKTMIDYSSDEITTEEAQQLMEEVQKKLGNDAFQFYPGISYRHLLVWRNGLSEFELTPPHDISDKVIGSYLPSGLESEVLLRMMMESNKFLPELPVNQQRLKRGLRPATSIWLWGQGKKPGVPKFQEKYNLTGAMISAVDLTKGLGLCAGLDVIEVPGATGNVHTNFLGKAQAAMEQLKKGKDFVYVHIEAPDEAGHRGELENKIKAIEEIDEKVLGPILKGLEEFKDYKILIMPDHPTPLSIKTHTSDPVPFMIYQKSAPQTNSDQGYDEDSARAAGFTFEDGYKLMDYFIG